MSGSRRTVDTASPHRDLQRLEHCCPRLRCARLHRSRNHVPVASTISQLLEATRAHVGFALEHGGEQVLANVSHVAELARRYEAEGGISFRGFLEELRAQAESGEATEAPILEEGSDGVRLMTVHKAKGLEFPVVVLVDMTAKLHRATASRYLDTGRGVCAVQLAGCSPRDLIDHEQDELRRDAAEGARLAYVAATRARDLLVIPAVGDAEREGWIQSLNSAIYPPMETRRQQARAPGCVEFQSKDSVLSRPDGDPANASTVCPGLHQIVRRAGPMLRTRRSFRTRRRPTRRNRLVGPARPRPRRRTVARHSEARPDREGCSERHRRLWAWDVQNLATAARFRCERRSGALDCGTTRHGVGEIAGSRGIGARRLCLELSSCRASTAGLAASASVRWSMPRWPLSPLMPIRPRSTAWSPHKRERLAPPPRKFRTRRRSWRMCWRIQSSSAPAALRMETSAAEKFPSLCELRMVHWQKGSSISRSTKAKAGRWSISKPTRSFVAERNTRCRLACTSARCGRRRSRRCLGS